MTRAEAKDLSATCERYAVEMLDPKHVLKRPEEYDFRGVTNAELEAAIHYEYARSNASFRSEVNQLLSARVRGLSLRERLLLDKSASADEIYPKHSITVLMMVEDYPLFPCPWMAFEREDTRQIVQQRLTLKPQSLSDWNDMPEAVRRARLNAAPERHWYFYINWNDTLDNIKSDFAAWLKTEAKKQQRDVATGNAARKPYHRLKNLAAFRLHRAGLRTHDAAKNFLDKKPDAEGVLPRFESAGSWHKAWRTAEQMINQQPIAG